MALFFEEKVSSSVKRFVSVREDMFDGGNDGAAHDQEESAFILFYPKHIL